MTASSSFTRTAMQSAVSRLPRLSRSVFLLHATADVSLAEIASRLGMTSEQVEDQLAYALAEIDRQIGTYSPAEAVAPGSARD